MEVEMMVLSDDGQTTRTAIKRRQSLQETNGHKFNFFRLGLGCLAMALLAVLAVVVLVASAPTARRLITQTKGAEEDQKIILKAMFSTTYIPNNQSRLLDIKNVNDITDQVDIKFNGKKLRIVSGFFHGYSYRNEYYQANCENPLLGNVLQLNIAAFYASRCPSQNENACRAQMEDLRKQLYRMWILPVTIRFTDDHLISISIKLCSITEMIDPKPTTALLELQKMRTTPTSATVLTESARENFIDTITPYVALKQSRCTFNRGRIVSVQMEGAFGSRIQDGTRLNAIVNNDQYQQYRVVTLYEDTTYRVQVQLDCNGQADRDSYQNTCHLSQNINVWIDLNDNGIDDGESRVLRRPRANRKPLGSTYDLDLQIPLIDDRNTKSGSHRMRLTATPSEQYRRDCGNGDYDETRDYTVNIVPKPTYSGVADSIPSNIVYQGSICSENIAKISLILMAGERGTEIRDDQQTKNLLIDYQDRHHLAVTVYDHSIYLMRIQLDCSWQLNADLFENGCNLAQDVHVWIDINNDGSFDELENRAPYRWPVTSYMAQGIYDIQLYIPSIDDRYLRAGQHRMRVVVMHTEDYRRTCGRADYNETREYTINIVSRRGYLALSDATTPYMVFNNIVCSAHVGKIVLVVMAGEHRTQIREDSSSRTLANGDYRNRPSQAIVLFEDTVYQLRIQLDCNRHWTNDASEHSCSLAYDVNIWIDLNDDGIFDSSEDAVPHRWPLKSYTPQGVYDLQLYVPPIDAQRTRDGPHRMRLVVTMNEQYRRKCGDNDYKEVREFTVSIVPNTRQAVDTRLPYLTLSDAVCSQRNGKIALVIMAGEQGTHIRDNIPTNSLLGSNQNQHHLGVTLFDNTIYRIRIQLDCFPHYKGGYPESDCNVAQDVNILIDFNNDGRFDETESRVPHRWPLLSSLPLGIYDLEINVPIINETNIKSGPHRMRIIALPSDEYRRKCGNTNYQETREYTVNIIPKTTYRELEYQHAAVSRNYEVSDLRAAYCLSGNFVCSNGNSAISMISLYGEQGTQIRDDLKQCNSMNNYVDRTHLKAMIFDDTTYNLRISVHCASQLNSENSYSQDSYSSETSCSSQAHYLDVWIDLNNDGVFDQNEERIASNNWYTNDPRNTLYDLSITIPNFGGRNYLNEPHRMRIILTQDERSRRPCQGSGYGEARDYTVQILKKLVYRNS